MGFTYHEQQVNLLMQGIEEVVRRVVREELAALEVRKVPPADLSEKRRAAANARWHKEA